MLAGASLAVHLPEVRAATDVLAPGLGGAALLLLAQLAYVPNAIIWAIAYALGPGFAFGVGTVVAPTGSVARRGPRLPDARGHAAGARPGGPGWVPVVVLALPYLAGMFAGVVTVRIAPTPVIEAAPLWGFTAGAATGVLAGLAAAFAGGSLGNGRLAAVGPSGLAGRTGRDTGDRRHRRAGRGAANWLILRRATRRRTADQPAAGGRWPAAAGGRLSPLRPGMVDETDAAGGHRIYLNPWAASTPTTRTTLRLSPARDAYPPS